jgi:hypothetical protein
MAPMTPRFLVGCVVALFCSAMLAGGLLYRSPSGRFVPRGDYVALDTATGRTCWSGIEGTQDLNLGEPLPICARLWSGTGLWGWR